MSILKDKDRSPKQLKHKFGEDVNLFLSSAAMELEIIVKSSTGGIFCKKVEAKREYSDRTKRKHAKTIQQLLEEFDLEKTINRYRSSDHGTLSCKALGIRDKNFQREILHLTDTDLIKINDKDWTQIFHKRMKEKNCELLDKKERILAEEEKKRTRNLKLNNIRLPLG